MNPELLVLRVILARSKYLQYRHLVEVPEEKLVALLYKELDKLSEGLNRDLTEAELFAAVVINNPLLKPEEKELLHGIRESLSATEIAEDAVEALLTSIEQRKRAFEIADASISVADGRRSWDSYIEFVQNQIQYSEKDTGHLEENFVLFDFEEIYGSQIKDTGLRWRLNCLNESLGSLRRGNFGFLFARPESGKTTFLADTATYFAEQSTGPGFYFNNEQEGKQVALRCYQSALNKTTQELIRDLHDTQKQYMELTKGNLRLFDSASIHRKEVEQLCSKYQPAFLIFDQLDKIKGFDSEREDLRLGTIYQWARELAKSYCPVIGVTQADGSGEGKKWLTMENVSNAKTAKQAEADFIIGIGKIHDPGYEFVRYLNISKNKLVGDEDTKPELRHGKFEVLIDVDRGRYRDI